MINPDSFGRIVGTVTVRNPAPWIIAALLFAGLLCFAMLPVTPRPLEWLVATSAAACILAGVAIAIYGVFRRPELLRSETHVRDTMLIRILENNDSNPRAVAIARDLLPTPEAKLASDKTARISSRLVKDNFKLAEDANE